MNLRPLRPELPAGPTPGLDRAHDAPLRLALRHPARRVLLDFHAVRPPAPEVLVLTLSRVVHSPAWESQESGPIGPCGARGGDRGCEAVAASLCLKSHSCPGPEVRKVGGLTRCSAPTARTMTTTVLPCPSFCGSCAKANDPARPVALLAICPMARRVTWRRCLPSRKPQVVGRMGPATPGRSERSSWTLSGRRACAVGRLKANTGPCWSPSFSGLLPTRARS